MFRFKHVRSPVCVMSTVNILLVVKTKPSASNLTETLRVISTLNMFLITKMNPSASNMAEAW